MSETERRELAFLLAETVERGVLVLQQPVDMLADDRFCQCPGSRLAEVEKYLDLLVGACRRLMTACSDRFPVGEDGPVDQATD